MTTHQRRDDHVDYATTKLKTTNINFASFFVKLPNKIPTNISGYTVCSFSSDYGMNTVNLEFLCS